LTDLLLFEWNVWSTEKRFYEKQPNKKYFSGVYFQLNRRDLVSRAISLWGYSCGGWVWINARGGVASEPKCLQSVIFSQVKRYYIR